MNEKLILTDVDGVLLSWEYAFDCYLQERGYHKVEGYQDKYDIGKRYGIDSSLGKSLIKTFNESAAIGFLPPHRDAIHYVRKLYEEHGYIFHAITSLSLDKNAYRLRCMNLEKLFGSSVFEKIICLDTGADKDDALLPYKGSECYWVEDKYDNCLSGLKLGLTPLLMEHGHNMQFNNPGVTRVKNWQEIYNIIVGI